jgi:hypothetical protein
MIEAMAVHLAPGRQRGASNYPGLMMIGRFVLKYTRSSTEANKDKGSRKASACTVEVVTYIEEDALVSPPNSPITLCEAGLDDLAVHDRLAKSS